MADAETVLYRQGHVRDTPPSGENAVDTVAILAERRYKALVVDPRLVDAEHEAETLDNRLAERAGRGVVGVAQRPQHACRRTRNARRLRMRRTNEGRVVDAAVKLLEASHGQAADPGGENPDRNGDRSGVDWCMRIRDTRYWMEHTLVQPFPSERLGGETVDKVARHLEMQGTNLGGPGCYEIILAADAQIANGSKGDHQLETLDQWMKETAARWPPLRGRSRSEKPGAVDKCKTERPEDWQSMVTLQRRHASYVDVMKRTPGSVKLAGRRTPADLETAQRRTVERALEMKTEKLEKAAKLGGRTVLVFETEQSAFDNLENIGTALRGLPRRLTERVDDVILVETAIDPWHATFLKHGDWIRPAGAPPGGLTPVPHDAWRSGGRNAPIDMENRIEVPTGELTDLTAGGNPATRDD